MRAAHTRTLTLKFLSTLSLRRATRIVLRRRYINGIFLSTLSLRRATRPAATHCKARQISIHALLAESDPCITSVCFTSCAFLSTLSLRRATATQLRKAADDLISIHALLAESDHFLAVRLYAAGGISIHALLAESDHEKRLDRWPIVKFLSTLSLRRATLGLRTQSAGGEYFYPRSPCGERLLCWGCNWAHISISIHALLAESDIMILSAAIAMTISIHALLAESDRLCTRPVQH